MECLSRQGIICTFFFLYNLIITYDDVKVLYSSNLLVEDMTSRKNIDVPYDLSVVTDDIEILRLIDDSQSPVSRLHQTTKNISILSTRWKVEISMREAVVNPCKQQMTDVPLYMHIIVDYCYQNSPSIGLFFFIFSSNYFSLFVLFQFQSSSIVLLSRI